MIIIQPKVESCFRFVDKFRQGCFHWINANLNLDHAGAALKKLEDEKGIIIRFVIGRRF